MRAADRIALKRRTTIVGIVFGLLLVAIGVKAFYIQVMKSPWLSEKASDQYTSDQTLEGKRGTIFDTRMRELAVSIEVTSIAAYPARIPDLGAAAAALARPLHLKTASLRRKLAAGKSFVWVKRQAVPREVAAVRALDLPGIDFIPEHRRFYPNRQLAAQVLGFAGIDGNGLEGLEYRYDALLRAREATFTVMRDALGRGFASEDRPLSATESGSNLILTIDQTIQFIAEKALAEAVTTQKAKSGMALVMAPDTGALLAVAHVPSFNPNAFGRSPKSHWRNRAITDPFEPGSTMKIFSMAAAIESGGLTRQSIFFCENGAYQIGKNVVHDTKGHGWLSLEQIMKFSSNIGAVKVGEKIGPETLSRTLRAFGFGARTGIDCPGETTGNLSPYRKWAKIDAGTIAFGQGISVSALQLVTAASAIANGGTLMRPYLVRAVTDSRGRPVQTFAPTALHRVISAGTAAAVSRMMEAAVSQGSTGTNAQMAGYQVCGKTGTAQKIDKTGGYARDRYIASFLGFVPVQRPALAILVVVNEPQESHYGGTVAAPVFRKIAHEALDYLGVPPQETKNLMVYRQQEARG